MNDTGPRVITIDWQQLIIEFSMNSVLSGAKFQGKVPFLIIPSLEAKWSLKPASAQSVLQSCR